MLSALLCLTGCRLHDDYTGEPFFRLEYTVEGEHYVYEDWGHIQPGYLLSSSYFEPDSFNTGLYSRNADANESVAFFSMQTLYLSLFLASDWRFFTDGKRYTYNEDLQKQGLEGCTLYYPRDARITGGWYSLTRNSSEPYGVYDVRFEFTCRDGEGDFMLSDGIIKVGRRLQRDVKSLIKNEERP